MKVLVLLPIRIWPLGGTSDPGGQITDSCGVVAGVAVSVLDACEGGG